MFRLIVQLAMVFGLLFSMSPVFAKPPLEVSNFSNVSNVLASNDWQWSAGLAWHHYDEKAMKMQGPELVGLVRLPAWHGWRVTGELGFARLDYSSTNTGSMSGVPWFQTRWSAMQPVTPSSSALGYWGVGPVVTAYYNDLQGVSTNDHLGYERLGAQLWASLHYVIGRHHLEVSKLLRGSHESRLSQAGGAGDIVNQQRRGWSLSYEYQLTLAAPKGWRFQGRWIQVDKSDLLGAAGWHEPRNETFRIALIRDF